MSMISRAILAVFLGLLSVIASAQDAVTGPVIKDFGPVMMPPKGSYNLDPDTHYKVSIDIGKRAEFPGDLNPWLVSSARFLNMHAQTGIPKENIEFAIVVHGEAAIDLLNDAAYEKRETDSNPNIPLLEQLKAAGANIYLCSQTALFRNMKPEEFHPSVTMAMSAMTTHVRLQHEGYTLIPF